MIKINPENIEAIIEAQKVWIDKLQSASRHTEPILIKVLEGAKPDHADYDLYGWKPYTEVWEKVTTPIYTRGILTNEIVIDTDAVNWNNIKEEVGKVIQYCDSENIPYTMGFSGGKGIHLNILYSGLSAGTKEDSEALYADIEKYNIDAVKISRKVILDEILRRAGADPEKMGLDIKKVNFSTYNKGSQLRTFGSTRSPGKYKTLITSIPETKPEPGELPLMFPEKVEVWDIKNTEFNDVAIKAIRQIIEKCENSEDCTPILDENFKGSSISEFPCIARLFDAGVKTGRYNACCSVVLACKKCGLSKEDTEKNLKIFGSTIPNLTPDEINYRVADALRIYDSSHRFSCTAIREDFPELNLCDFQNCPIKEKVDAKKAEEAETEARDKINSEIKNIKASPDKSLRIQQVKKFISNCLIDVDETLAEEVLLTKIKEPFCFNNAEFSLIKKHLKTEQKKQKAIKAQREKANKEYLKISFGDTADYAGNAVATLARDVLTEYSPVFFLGGQLYVYNGRIYETSDKVEADLKKFIYQQANKHGVSATPKNVDQVIKRVADEKTINPSELTHYPERIVVRNGILDVLTGEIYEHTPYERHIAELDITYDPTAPLTEDFVNYLKSTFKGDEWQIELFQEMFGYCLYKGYNHEVFFFLIGDGGNGRSTATNLLSKFLGEDNICSKKLQEICDPRDVFSLMGLHGKLANICGETGVKGIDDFSNLKQVTGRDRIEARMPYKPWVKFFNYAKMVFSMNQMPYIQDSTRGRRRRMKIIHFRNAFFKGVNADPNLEDKITSPESLTGVLNWGLQGLQRLFKNGDFSDIRNEAQISIEYEMQSNPVRHFVMDHIDASGSEYDHDATSALIAFNTSKVTYGELLQAYTAYMKKHNLPSLDSKVLASRVKIECEKVGIIVKTCRSKYRKGEVRYDYFKGIALCGLDELGINTEAPKTQQEKAKNLSFEYALMEGTKGCKASEITIIESREV